MSELKLTSKNENENENNNLSGGVSVDIKSHSKKLVRTTNGLCRDSLTLYRNFNGLMRNFYQENYGEKNNFRIIDSQSLRKTSVRHIEVEELDGRAEELDGRAGELDKDKDKEKERHFNQIPREKNNTILRSIEYSNYKNVSTNYKENYELINHDEFEAIKNTRKGVYYF